MIKQFAYYKPSTLAEAFAALQTEGSIPLAGGTDLLVELRGGVKSADLIVDLKGLPGLAELGITPDNGISIGAGVDLNFLVDHGKLREFCPLLSEAAYGIATYQLRNRATLVGNICNASPAADMAPPLLVLDAVVVAAGPDGERRIPIHEFFAGVKKTSLERGEIVVRVEIPPVPKAKMVFLKKQRLKGHDLAAVNLAGLADSGSGTLRISIGACAVTPIMLEGTDQLYRENKDVEKLAEKVAALAVNSIKPIDDLRSTAEYRRDMAAVLAGRLIRKICS
ncbi:MAG: xanthine dehydrogenase family protein subunit M [Spirochaeta sp.]|nr:xanthine dehydrogenase family protein subunit M [Spirochaeta sp.]